MTIAGVRKIIPRLRKSCGLGHCRIGKQGASTGGGPTRNGQFGRYRRSTLRAIGVGYAASFVTRERAASFACDPTIFISCQS